MAGTVRGPSRCPPHGWSSVTHVPRSPDGDDPAASSFSSSWMEAWFQAPGLLQARGLHSLPPLSYTPLPGDTVCPIPGLRDEANIAAKQVKQAFWFPSAKKSSVHATPWSTMCACVKKDNVHPLTKKHFITKKCQPSSERSAGGNH